MIPHNSQQMVIPPLIGHRGASSTAPENTLPSFRRAWREGADGIEGDFWLTVDGRIVCIHDPTTERTAPGQEAVDVRCSRHPELGNHDVGSWKGLEFAGTTIPTLDEILAEMIASSSIYVEIKQNTPEIVSALLAVVAASPVNLSQVTLISFSPDIIRLAKQRAPAMRAFLLYDLDDLKAQATVESLVDLAVATAADGLGLGNSRRIDARLVELIRRKGLQFHVWTVNRADDALRLMRLGVDSLTTDRPQGLRADIIAQLGQEGVASTS